MKKLLFAMAIGAGLAWMYDPEAGSRRREGLRKKLDALSGSAKSAAPDLGAVRRGVVRRPQHVDERDAADGRLPPVSPAMTTEGIPK